MLFLTSIVISIPYVQTKIINKISDSVFNKIGHDVDIEYLNIRWFDTILIQGLTVYDTKEKEMIKADRVILDFKLGKLITQSSISLDKAILQGAAVTMINNTPHGQFNLNFFIDEIKENLIRKNPDRKEKKFLTDKIILTKSMFKIYRNDKEIIKNRFDQYHFTLQNIEAILENFTVKSGELAFAVNELACLDSATGLDIKELKTNFGYTRKSMVFQNMDMKFGKSSISQSMVFNYLQPSSVKEFVDSVNITANVKKSIIHSKDLGLFITSLNKYNEYYKFKGFVEGPVKRLSVKNITLQLGANSELKGYISTYGLPNVAETFISAKVSSAKIQNNDLSSYMSEDSFENIKKFGLIRLEGGFSGFPGDFVSNASFRTSIGEFDTDINLKLGKAGQDKATYSGKLTTKNFDLGILLGDTALYQYIDLDGSINGSGFLKENARVDLVSSIKRIGINGYDYQNIQTDAVLAEQFFNGNLSIDDPNLQFNGKLGLNLNKDFEVIDIEATLGKANLDTMRITTVPAFLSSSLNVHMKGLGLDEMTGNMFLDDTYFTYGDKELCIDRLNLISEKDSLSRKLIVKSPNLDLHIFGDFDYSALLQDINDVFKEYQLIFRNNSAEINAYYANKNKDYSDYYYLDYDINLKDVNPIINLFLPEFYISENTKVVGAFTGGPTKLVQLRTQFDSLIVNNLTFEGNNITFNTRKNSDTTLVYASYEVSSENLMIDDTPSSENMNCQITWDGNEIDFLLGADQSNSTNYAKLSGHLEFLPDVTNIKLNNSEINIIDKIWRVNEKNLFSIRQKQYEIQHFSIYHGDQKINFNGKLSENPDDQLFVSIINFDVKNLNPLITKRLDGVFNGLIDVKDFFNQKEINGRLKIQDFSINEFLVGDIIAYSEFDNTANQFDVNLNINRNGLETVLVDGYIKPYEQKENLNLNATLTDANLYLIEPFFEKYISDVSGYLDGNIKITGEFINPILKGEGKAKSGEFTLDYLNTHYDMEGLIVFDNDFMDFKEFTLTDPFGNKGNMYGRITHNGFKELGFDFYGDFEKFLVMNTTSKHNSLYYGTAFTTGDLRIFGKEKVFNISANATSERGTKFYIPLEGSEEVIKEDFINFISMADTLIDPLQKEGEKIGLSGISLNLELDITPDAYCEIIFDLTAGDIIRGRGNGKLNLQIDTKGDFYMFGDYEITEGGYNFTLYNIINKEFEIEPNSKITWIGDPYEAILDIRANYSQLASLIPILNVSTQTVQDNPELNRKYLAKVLLDINGNLSLPEIEFGIEVEDYPKNATYDGVSIETQMSAFKNKLATNEQELKRQVFSLIILRRFSEENAFNVGGSVEKSVSEFISNQISYWITQFDENLVVDVDLGSLDNEAFNTFQLRMSYSFLNGRLRVTRDGGFTDQTTGTTAASILGDWSVEYLLSPEGKLRAKIYNKTNYNTIDPTRKSTSTTAGFSILHTQNFNHIKNIFKNSRDKNQPNNIDQDPENNSKEEDGISQRIDTLKTY